MGWRHRAFVAGIVAALAIAPTATAADPATGYQGTWDSASVCGAEFPVGGTWNVVLKRDGTAEVTIVTFVGGKAHAVWGGNFWRMPWQQQATDGIFLVTNQRGLVFDLAADGSLTYTLPSYCGAGLDAWIYGHLGR